MLLIKSILLPILCTLLFSCSQNSLQTLRSNDSGDRADITDNDEESLFGSLDYPAEDTLTTYLYANLENSEIRCQQKANLDDTIIDCYLVVVQYDGRELIAKGLEEGVKLEWEAATSTSNQNIGTCTTSENNLRQSCSLSTADYELLDADNVVNNAASLSNETKTAVKENKIKLKIKIGSVTGKVSTIPTSFSLVDPENISASSGLTLDAADIKNFGFQPISDSLKNQKIISSRGNSFINSACMRDNKVYFTAGLNAFWIKDWTDPNAEIQLYAGASSTGGLFNTETVAPSHRLWLPLRNEQSVHCAPDGVVLVDQANGVIWRLWDDGRTKKIIGNNLQTGYSCDWKMTLRDNLLSKDNLSPIDDINLGCIGGLDINPVTGDIYFAHSPNQKLSNTDIYKYDNEKNKISHLMTFDNDLGGHYYGETVIINGIKRRARARSRSKTSFFELKAGNKALTHNFNRLVEVDLNNNSWKYLTDRQTEPTAFKGLHTFRGVFSLNDKTYPITEQTIYEKRKRNLTAKSLLADKITSDNEYKDYLLSSENRHLKKVTNAKDIFFRPIQMFSQNKIANKKNGVLVEYDSVRIVDENLNVQTLFAAYKEQRHGCGKSLVPEDELMPFITDLDFHENGELFISTTGLRNNSENGDGSFSDELTFFDMLTFKKESGEGKLHSHSGCIAGTLDTDNKKASVSVKDSSLDTIAIRQDYSSTKVGETLFIASGADLFKKENLKNPNEPVTKFHITAETPDQEKLAGIMDKMVKIDSSTFTFAQLIEIATAYNSGNFSALDQFFENYMVETPILGISSQGEYVYVVTGLLAMTGELIGLLEGETQEGSISKEGAVNIPVLSKLVADYKIVRVNTRTNKSDIIYHGMPEKQSVSRINLSFGSISFEQNIRGAGLWLEPWNLGKAGLKTFLNGDTIDAYLTLPFIFRVDQLSFNKDYSVDGPNFTRTTIAGRRPTEDNPPRIRKVINEPATSTPLWSPWDLSVTDRGDIFIAEAVGGGLKRLFKNSDGEWTINSVYGGDVKKEAACTAGTIDKELENGASVDGSINQSTSALCQGDIWGVEATDTCSADGTGEMTIYMAQSFFTASNVVEIIRSCD